MEVAIRAEGLTKRYGSSRGVDDLDFEVPAGAVFGFLGPNGAGKSTTIRTLMDFQRPTAGTATVLGLDSRRDAVEIHRRTGYLPGDLQLYPRLTGREHLDGFDRVRGRSKPDVVASLVERFRIELDRPIRELSKGNRQKVGVLLAFADEPELLVLDEPTSGLDPLMQEEFGRLLREVVATGRTVFLSSHSLDEVQRVADRVTLIGDGRLLVTDSIAELQRSVPRSIDITFATEVGPGPFAHLEGVVDAVGDGRRVRLRVLGGVDAVVKAAARHPVEDLVAHPADLEDLFLRYYGVEGRDGDGDQVSGVRHGA